VTEKGSIWFFVQKQLQAFCSHPSLLSAA